MYRRASTFLIATAMIGAPATAAAPALETASSSYTIGISGFVPVICRASLDANVVPATPGETALGELNEFCNSPNGYQIFVQSSPELANATLVVDGKAMTLSAEGPTLVATSSGPAINARNVTLSSASGAGGSLSFQIVAL